MILISSQRVRASAIWNKNFIHVNFGHIIHEYLTYHLVKHYMKICLIETIMRTFIAR